jgi:hypothetical protein
LKLVFKSDSEKLERDPFFEADNNYELGNISFRLQEKDYKILRRIYDKGYDNFYLVVVSNNSSTQLYSGKYLFYEDVTFVNTTSGTTTTDSTVNTTDQIVVNTTNVDSPTTTIDAAIVQNNPFVSSNMSEYTEDTSSDKNYTNLLIYVRYQINIDKMDAYLTAQGITPMINYGNMYFLKRVYATQVVDIKSLDYIEKVFEIPLTTGLASKTASTSQTNSTLNVYVTPATSTTTPTLPYTPPQPSITVDKATWVNINKKNTNSGLIL